MHSTTGCTLSCHISDMQHNCIKGLLLLGQHPGLASDPKVRMQPLT